MKYIITIVGFFIYCMYPHHAFSNSIMNAVRDVMNSGVEATDNRYVFTCLTIAPNFLSSNSVTSAHQFNAPAKYCKLYASFVLYKNNSDDEHSTNSYLEDFFPNLHNREAYECFRRDGDRPAMPIPIPGVGDQKPIKCDQFIPQLGSSFLLYSGYLGNYNVPSTGEKIVLIDGENKLTNGAKRSHYKRLSQLRIDSQRSYEVSTQDFYITYDTTIYPLVRKDSSQRDTDRPAMPIPIPGVGELAFFWIAVAGI